MRVQIAFDLAPNGVGNWFTLDDATKGALNNTTYKLAGDVLVDVTSKVRSVSVKRGRSRQLDKFTAGAANIVLSNRDRTFDPLNASSPYYGNIIPGKEVVITHNDQAVYVGNVADWNFGYDLGGDSTAEPSVSDGFSYLAQQVVAAGTATAQLSSARIGTALSQLGWPLLKRQISTGAATLDADVIPPDTNALNYLQKVETSEVGAFFIGKQGFAVFKSRTDLQAYTSGVTFGTGGIPFSGIDVVYGIEEMTNKVSVTYTAGSVVAGTAVANDTASQAKYGVMAQQYDTLLASSTDAATFANWQVNQYSEPRYRVNSITVPLGRLTSAQLSSVLGLELGDEVQVTWTPGGVGSALSQIVTIDGIEHQATPDWYEVTFTLSQALAAFILDNTTFGVLDQNVLGF